MPECGNWEITLRFDNPSGPVGSLFYRVEPGETEGEFVGQHKCTGPDDGPLVFASYNPMTRRLVTGFFSESEVPVGTAIKCLFYGSFEDPPLAEDFAVFIDLARSPAEEPVTVTPSIELATITQPDQCRNGCGDGVVATYERCDDGNSLSDDACVECEVSRCGDGAVRAGVEGCDEGDHYDFDDCPSSCEPASCGDGYLRIGTELCDDGNTDGSDDCAECVPSSCGDGVLQTFEACDDGASVSGDGCTRFCAFEASCGNPIPDGEVKPADALMVLRRSVGIDAGCPPWACDVNSNGSVTATDALAVLKRSVGLPVSLSCSGPSAVLIRAYSTGSGRQYLGSLHAEIGYSLSDGEFGGEGADVECESIAPDIAASFDDDETTSTLEIDVQANPSVYLPLDIARCTFTSPTGFSSDEFRVPVLHAKRWDDSRLPGLLLEIVPD